MTKPRKTVDLNQDDIITKPLDVAIINMLRWKSISPKLGNWEFRIEKLLDTRGQRSYTNTMTMDNGYGKDEIIARRERQTKKYKKVR